jgi:elongation factor 2
MGRKEDNIKKAERLIHDKEHIRNIGTAAHIDHGKCVAGRTRIWVNGTWVRAEDLWTRFADRPPVENAQSAEVRDITDASLWSRAIDLKSGTSGFAQMTHVWRLKADEPLIEVDTRDGRRIRTTREHRFVAAEGHSLQFRPGACLQPGDLLAVPRKLPSREDDEGWAPLDPAISGRTTLSRLPRFHDDDKANRHRMLESRAGPSYVVDRVPVDWSRPGTSNWKSRMYERLDQRPSTASLLTMVEDPSALETVLHEDLAFVEVRSVREVEEEWVYDFSVPGPRNFVAEGLFVHNTTLSDSLIAGAGMISQELAGQQLFMDFDEQEQARGITINAAIASMVHDLEGTQYLVNLIDTPGHVDFGGDVTRAMRAIDGVIILVDAVEGVMPQTETVIRQALKERVKPVLFINKVDRLINELKVTPEVMQQRFQKIITEVNGRILKLAPEGEQKVWALDVTGGSVAFGSAVHKWAISVPYMQKSKITFKDVYDYCQRGEMKELSKRAPLHQVVLDMVIHHLPNPKMAQKVRVPTIWKGDLESGVGKSMLAVNEKGPVAYMVTKIIVDPHAGEVAAGRLFSGTIKRGMELWIGGMPNPNRVQTVAMIVGADRVPVEEITAGNVVACIGLKDAIAGSTVSSEKDMHVFERIVHYSEPVVTVAIEAKSTADLPKLVDALRSLSKADPSIRVEIDQETGQHLMSGMGELHLEITQYRVVNDYKIPITASAPIVVYRENVEHKGGPFEGKSPNKHNRFYFEVEPLPAAVMAALKSGEVPSGQRIKDSKALAKQLQDLGMDKDEAKSVVWIHEGNLLLDMTKGIQNLHETMELVKDSFIEAMDRGPLAAEKCMGLKARLVDAKLHEDSIHRGPAQVIPAVRNSIYGAMVQGERVLLEPIQKLYLNCPQEVMGAALGDIQGRRAEIEDIQQEGEAAIVSARTPVAEMFGFATSIRGATQGRVIWNTENAGFVPTPASVQGTVVQKIRERKGLPPTPYDAAYYAG